MLYGTTSAKECPGATYDDDTTLSDRYLRVTVGLAIRTEFKTYTVASLSRPRDAQA